VAHTLVAEQVGRSRIHLRPEHVDDLDVRIGVPGLQLVEAHAHRLVGTWQAGARFWHVLSERRGSALVEPALPPAVQHFDVEVTVVGQDSPKTRHERAVVVIVGNHGRVIRDAKTLGEGRDTLGAKDMEPIGGVLQPLRGADLDGVLTRQRLRPRPCPKPGDWQRPERRR
jgi:hypothetical protein